MKKLKNFTHYVVCLLLLTNINTYGQFKSMDFGEMITPYLIMTQEYNKLEADINELLDYVSAILSQDIDAEMRKRMNEEYRSLNSLAKELSNNGMRGIREKYNTIHRRIKSEIFSYNNRIAEARERSRIEADKEYPAEWGGTGFALKDGYVVTNYHVVEDADLISIHGIKGNFQSDYEAEVIAIDKHNDIALLKITSDSFSGFGNIPYSVNTTTSEVGEEIFVLGYPLTSTMGNEIKLTTGVVSSKTGFQGDVSLYQISAPVQPGNSGGPLFDSRGNLIGIVSSRHQGAENVGYAVKTAYLRNLLESCASASLLPSNNQGSNLPLTEKVKNVKDFIFMIKCHKRQQQTLVETQSSRDKYNIDSETISKNTPNSFSPIYKHTADGFEIENLYYRKQKNNKGLKIVKVEITTEHMVVELECDNSIARYREFSISPNIHLATIIPIKGNLLKAEGIPVEPNKYKFASMNEKKRFRLFFHKLPKEVEWFHLIDNDYNLLNFYEIRLTEHNHGIK